MCLRKRLHDSDKPYDESKIRYKLIMKQGEQFTSPFVGQQKWVPGVWYDAVEAKVGKQEDGSVNHMQATVDPVNFGFHVYTTLPDAIAVQNVCACIIGKFEVDGFIASGGNRYFNQDQITPEETWKRAKLIEIVEVPSCA